MENEECDRKGNILILGRKVNDPIERWWNGTSGSDDVDFHVYVEDRWQNGFQAFAFIDKMAVIIYIFYSF